jgi:hypothetical protein
VILLDAIVEIVIAAMSHLMSQALTDRTRVGIMPIGRHPFWSVTDDVESLLEKALGGLQISLLAQSGVHQIPIPIDGTIEITPFAMDADVRFIDVPRGSCLPASLSTQLIRHERGKTRFPVSNGLMRELKASLQKHLGQVTQAQLIPQPPQHNEQNNIGGVLQKVERRSGALVEGVLARRAAERPIPQQRFLGLFLGGR